MSRIINTRRPVVWVLFALSAVGVTTGLTCPDTGGGTTNPPVPEGNRPPRINITSILTDFGNNFAEVGDPVTVNFTGEDAEDAAVARIFASQSGNPTPQQEIPILGGFPVGPGTANGTAVWDTTGIPTGPYNIFAEIDDRTLDPFTGTGNPPVRVVSASPVQVGPQGSQPLTSPPQIVWLTPTTNVSLSANDEMTMTYIFADVDSTATVTLLLDKDLNPFNDDVNNPGDPSDPGTNIIILPTAAREPLDPTFDGDPPPPGTPEDPIVQPDSLEVRQNPRILAQTIPGQLPFPGAPLAGDLKTYIFTINFAQIPPRTSPYFVRATVTDGGNVRHAYAVGSISINSVASGIVDVNSIGFGVSGARFFGFQNHANLGSSILGTGDLDSDGVGEFVIGSRFASPRGRLYSGAAYLVHGRSKIPFPADTDGDGLPDGGQLDDQDNVINFPEPPGYITNPYNQSLVGRFGGAMNIESVGGTAGDFIRGTIYVMPSSWGGLAVPADPLGLLTDPSLPGIDNAGLTSITHVNITGLDTGVPGVIPDSGPVPDLIFGLPFVSSPQDYHDDDPADGCDSGMYQASDQLPNRLGCAGMPGNDDLWSLRQPMREMTHMGLVIGVDATNNTAVDFPKFIDAAMAGQFDEADNAPRDDENVALSDDQVPRGVRLRGGWLANEDEFTALGYVDPSGFGHTVSLVESVDNDNADDLLISIPYLTSFFGDPNVGGIQVWLTDNYIAPDRYTDLVRSLPSYATGTPLCPNGPCTMGVPVTDCIRCTRGDGPVHFTVEGAEPGDHLGFAVNGGDVNLDSNAEILAGAPGADRDGLTDNGVVYVIYTLGSGFAQRNIEDPTITSLQLRGSHNGDAFGRVQVGLSSMSGDNFDDTAIGAEGYDDPVRGADAGFVGVIFGRADAVGIRSVEDIGTAVLPGVVFIGAHGGARAGASISSAGDFNGDGAGDLLIACPGETRLVDGVTRVGIAYLVFGGPHLLNQRFNLDQVGSPQLPGIVFIARTLLGVGAETLATIDHVGGVGDVDGDGFDDIILGAPQADFVDTQGPTQRLINAGEAYLIYGNNFGTNTLP